MQGNTAFPCITSYDNTIQTTLARVVLHVGETDQDSLSVSGSGISQAQVTESALSVYEEQAIHAVVNDFDSRDLERSNE